MLTRRLSLAATVITVMVLAAACGGSKASPTAPESTAMPPVNTGAAGGATITGSVLTGAASPLTSTTSGAAITGLVVTVAGTSISSGLDAAGRFSLTGVPAGNVQLQFSGPVTATLPVNEVRPSETITMVVNVTSSAVVVESQLRSAGGEEQVEGRIESLPPTMPERSLKVAGRTIITTDSATSIRDPNETRAFSDLEIGQRVHVKGHASGTSLLAASIVIQNTIVTIPVNVNGEVMGLSGTGAAFQFEVGSVLVKGDSDTQFFGDGDAPDSFTSLKNGLRVEVKGQQRDGFVYAQRIHVNDDDDDDADDPDESASIQGRLTSKTGTTPNFTLIVGGTTVRTNGDTEVKRRGDFQTLAVLAVGQDLHVVGTRQSDGSLDARKIEINGDAPGGAFEIEGPVGGLQGGCPAVSFKVNGYQVRTNAATTFESVTCATLKSGDKVQVKGEAQADATVIAESVKKK